MLTLMTLPPKTDPIWLVIIIAGLVLLVGTICLVIWLCTRYNHNPRCWGCGSKGKMKQVKSDFPDLIKYQCTRCKIRFKEERVKRLSIQEKALGTPPITTMATGYRKDKT